MVMTGLTLENLEEQRAVGQNPQRFRLRTASHWIEGVFPSRHHRLGDFLNEERPHGLFLAEAVSVRSDQDGSAGERVGHIASLSAAAALFVIPMDDTVAPASDPRYFIRKRAVRVLVGIGQFEIVGNLHALEHAELRSFLANPGAPFTVLTNAILRRTDIPDYVEERSVVFVNRPRASFFLPLDSQGVAPLVTPGTTPVPPDSSPAQRPAVAADTRRTLLARSGGTLKFR